MHKEIMIKKKKDHKIALPITSFLSSTLKTDCHPQYRELGLKIEVSLQVAHFLQTQKKNSILSLNFTNKFKPLA